MKIDSSASNNPWEVQSDEATALNPLEETGKSNQFEDNFVEKENNSDCITQQGEEESASKSFERLEDSEEYLARLEKKLDRLTKPKESKKSLIKALSERRSDEARRYLDREAQIVSGDRLGSEEVNLDDNPVLRKIFPEKQALTVSELEKLLERDILDITSQEQQQVEEEGNKTQSEDITERSSDNQSPKD